MKTKPIILISVIFVIGFVLGMLTSAQIRNKKLQPVKFFFNEQRYVEGITRIIEPSAQQISDFNAIVNKYGELNGELNKEYRDNFSKNMDAFRSEIDSRLTKEQRDKIEEVEAERRRMFEEFAKHRSDSAFFRDGRDDTVHFRDDRNRRYNPPPEMDGNMRPPLEKREEGR